MDTCSRLGEPGGVGWKYVNVGRLRTTTSGKHPKRSATLVARGSLNRALNRGDFMTRYSWYGSRNYPRIGAARSFSKRSLELQYRELLELRECVRQPEAAALKPVTLRDAAN